jgi:Sigma-70, region 4
MGSLASLPPDQRAVLELVLRQGRSYDEIAKLLSIDRAGVRQRALAAFDALGPQTRVSAERRALIADYVLGALPPAVADEVRDHMSQSASERAWARSVSSELQGLTERPLPEIPAGAATSELEVAVAAPMATETAPPGADGDGSPARRPVSRRGGALLLGGAAAVAVAIVLVLVLPAGSNKNPHSPQASRTHASTSSTTSTNSARIVAQINLKPPSGANTPIGIAEVLSAQGQFGIAIAAQGLTANTKHPPNAYAVWLYNSPGDSHILGFVNPAVGSNGQLKTAGGLPTNASHYQKLLVTLETTSNPKSPGKIVLEGDLTGVTG